MNKIVDYTTKEIIKIMKNKDFKYPLNVAMSSVWSLGHFKGTNLKIIDVSKSSSLADYYCIGTAENKIAGKAMANEIIVQMKEHGVPVLSKEGMEEAEWLLIDLGDVFVHIFSKEGRDNYNLDDLWKEFPKIEIPQSYYIPESQISVDNKDEKGYF